MALSLAPVMCYQNLSLCILAVSVLAVVLVRRYIASRTLPYFDYFQLTGVPPPTPLPNFDIDKAKPRPYRPFRWEYHQTMSLKKLEPDWWIELESTYRDRVAQRKRLYHEHGRKVVDCMLGAELACRELMEMVIQYICVRYPKQFQFEHKTGIFHNKILGTRMNTYKTDPLIFLLETIPEDFLITQADKETGLYFLRAGVSCSAVGWNMSEKINRPLHEIHGPVPDYKEKMKMSMDRYFSKMPCDKPIQRGSWGLEHGQPLFLQADDPHFATRGHQSPTLDISEVYLRVDWQTLRRMPRSGAIVFNFKALFTPVTDFKEEPYIPRLVLKVLREGKSSIMDYKGTHPVLHKVIPALEEWAKEQEDKGWVPKDWKERTLYEDPFFPGWQFR